MSDPPPSAPLVPPPSRSALPKFGFSGFCLLIGIVTFAIQQGCALTGNAPSWIWGTVWFAIALSLIVLAIWFWDQTASHHWVRKSFLTVCVLVIMGGLSYIPIAKQYRAEHLALTPIPKTQSLPFVIGAPLGENDSPEWVMLVNHYGGPDPVYNCDISFWDADRKDVEHNWLVKHPNVSFPPKLAGESQTNFHISELDPTRASFKFQWNALDPNHQHYTIAMNCRDGVFSEKWDIVRVKGILRTAIKVERLFPSGVGPEKKPELIYSCTDPEFIDEPATPIIKRKRVNPGWKPHHLFWFPVAILDPNGNFELMVAKNPGCWKCLQEHCGGV